ncbi:hypothetical protein GMORB2_1419 [Geosmithia morbida]|uniref:Uncharacterized protein n=1 Tax=Geosmithia morbida TaxID=1094350 RepID=A0A9P4YZZ8_9HYPO|nr:uncharacterized protein GMORB2_1419 [Geosmithia morbida]KAF4126173.1 hypothetical protein GMORB2_1419 [Geosmithia morbida]
MTDSPSSLAAMKPTPKRKRGVNTTLTPIQFSFDPSRVVEDGADSPRSKVAHKFHGLAIDGEGGGGVPIGSSIGDDVNVAHESKRQRQDADMYDGPSDGPPVAEPSSVTATEPTEGGAASLPSEQPASHNSLMAEIAKAVSMRSGTPPPSLRKRMAEKKARLKEDDEEMDIVDPVRAALTWRDEEITIYDPEDVDDDGTGVNGVGFKPTPALAHARLMKRRQQLAEYRRREEVEARALRTQRRRGQHRTSSSPDGSGSPSRRVRFREDKTVSFIATPFSA